jgi:hypothetical protein
LFVLFSNPEIMRRINIEKKDHQLSDSIDLSTLKLFTLFEENMVP